MEHYIMRDQLINALNARYATKVFDGSKKISEADLNALIEAVRLTPTSYGLQLMKTVLVEDKKLRKALLKHSFGQEQVVDASHLMVLCREKIVDKSHIGDYIQNIATTRNLEVEHLAGFERMMNNSILPLPENEQNAWMDNQVYIALGNLLTACAILGVDACPMEGFVANKYNELLGLDELNLAAVLVVPIGYRSATDKNAKIKKVRRPNEQFLVRI